MAATNLASTSSTKARCFLLVLALLVLLLLVLLSHRIHCRCLCSHHRQSDNKALEMCSLHISIDALGWVEVGWGDDMIFGSSWGCFHVLYVIYIFEARWSEYYTCAVGAMIDHAISGIVMTFRVWHQHVYYIEWKWNYDVGHQSVLDSSPTWPSGFCTLLINLY